MHRHTRIHASQWFAAIALAAVMSTAASAGQTPITAAITYQGQLKSGGNPFTGAADFQFLLFDSSAGAGQVGSTLAIDGVTVTSGVFTVSLDFGQLAFAGDERWLEIRVNAPGNGGAGPYTTLVPRQRLTAAPYAAYALNVPNPSPFAFNGSNAVFTGGNVGIGTVNPTSRMHVAGDITATGIVQALNPTLESTVFLGWAADENGDDMARLRVGGNGVGAINGLDIQKVNNVSMMRILNSGNVGLGTTLPATRLHLMGTMRSQSGSDTLDIDSDSINTSGNGFFGDPLMLNDGSINSVLIGFGGGNCGVGGGAAGLPLVKLHVDGGSDAGLASGGFFVIGAGNTANIAMDNNEIMARSNGAASTLYLNNNGGDVRIGQNGAVGSTVYVKVLAITGGSDLSETFDVASIAQAPPEPGMVVCIDPDNLGKLLPSSRAYDRTVAGVISGANGVKTGMLMGQHGSLADGEHPVALTGRVYVRCVAADTAIRPGDLLTTSDAPGHAMRVDDHDRAQGAIIGKAMTTLAAGETGMVLVLVSLQ